MGRIPCTVFLFFPNDIYFMTKLQQKTAQMLQRMENSGALLFIENAYNRGKVRASPKYYIISPIIRCQCLLHRRVATSIY